MQSANKALQVTQLKGMLLTSRSQRHPPGDKLLGGIGKMTDGEEGPSPGARELEEVRPGKRRERPREKGAKAKEKEMTDPAASGRVGL